MESQPCRPIAMGKRRGKVCCSSCGLRYKMGGSRSTRHHYHQLNHEFPLEISGLPIRYTSCPGHGQQKTVWLLTFPRIVLKAKYQASLLNAFTLKQTGRLKPQTRQYSKFWRKNLGGKKGIWVEELLEVLWAYRMTKRSPTEETQFAIAFAVEVVVSVEIGSPSFRVTHYNPWLNDEGMKLCLDLVQERRNKAQMKIAPYQGKTSQYFNKRVKHRRFQVGDWVLREVTLATRDSTEGNLAPTWEGPYQIIGTNWIGAYHLENHKGKQLPHPWNAEHLKKYYI